MQEMKTTSVPTILDASAIEQLPLEPLDGIEGVAHKVLWRNGTSVSGVLTVEAGHRLGTHAHRVNHHHIWVLGGSATVLGGHLGPGSYVHIPRGVEHDIDATDTDGCTVFYLYIRQGV
jgi:quercetin dioxygenase-like cupin family protein